MSQSLKLGTVWTLLIVSLMGRHASAGDLGPPTGPITPTMKPLSVVETRIPISDQSAPGDSDSMFVISEPGSYYLAGDIEAVPNKHGITITASHVTLDLMGFSIVGDGSYGRDGVQAVADVANVTVRNGTVRGWGGDGLDLVMSECSRAENIVAAGNSDAGFAVSTRGMILRCVAQNNAFGILAFDGSTVVESNAIDNLAVGILTNQTALTRCAARDNGSAGIVAGNCTVTECTASGNGVHGISAGTTTLSYCTADSNALAGIAGHSGTQITNCTAFDNDRGIEASDGCAVLQCNARDNGIGVRVNTLPGHCRVEGNNTVGNEIGIQVQSADNLVIRNSASDNETNYDIVSGNAVGPIVTAENILTNNKPHANFEY